MKSTAHFADEKLKEAYEKLEDSKTENKSLHEWISKAIGNLEEDAFCGIQIPKRLIPKIYIKKYNIDNLWKCNLPKGWRLLYSVAKGEILIISIIIEWMTHKEYEKRFKY